MRKNRIVIGILLTIVILLILLCGGMLFLNHIHFFDNYLFAGGLILPRNAEYLNLRGKNITVKKYEDICDSLPNCEIDWDVPFQDTKYPEDTATISITSLSDADVVRLDYLQQLKKVDAAGCTDYEQIRQLKTRRPDVDVRYTVTIEAVEYPNDAKEISLSRLEENESALIQYLTELEVIDAQSCTDYVGLFRLQEQYPDCHVQYTVDIDGESYDTAVTEIVCEAPDVSEYTEKLVYLPKLETLQIKNPDCSAADLLAMQEKYPDIVFSWEMELVGQVAANQYAEPEQVTQVISSEDTEVELVGLTCTLEELKETLACFPNLEKVILSECEYENEDLAAFREEMRSEYKVVWTVQLGEKLTARTDDTSFMPVRERVYYFLDHEAVNLRYCEDMVCIDVGHMAIHDISFVEYMPNLKYLILAHTEVRDISSLETCKNLVFLELDWSTVRDFTPLLGCTALEDLNVGETFADLSPIMEMTWLNNLWMVNRSGAYKMVQALPDTKIVASGSATVANGWRDLPNYYAMRDELGMHYMTW